GGPGRRGGRFAPPPGGGGGGGGPGPAGGGAQKGAGATAQAAVGPPRGERPEGLAPQPPVPPGFVPKAIIFTEPSPNNALKPPVWADPNPGSQNQSAPLALLVQSIRGYWLSGITGIQLPASRMFGQSAP